MKPEGRWHGDYPSPNITSIKKPASVRTCERKIAYLIRMRFTNERPWIDFEYTYGQWKRWLEHAKERQQK